MIDLVVVISGTSLLLVDVVVIFGFGLVVYIVDCWLLWLGLVGC